MLLRGLLAGAAGTLALDTFTYLDMLVRARPASELPSTVVQKLAQKVDLQPLASDEGDAPKNRRSGAGAVFGYGVGLGAALVYAAVRPAFRGWLPWPVAGAVLGAATLVASEGSATALGATDWSTWTLSEWAMDLIPRALYGLTAAYVVERLGDDVAVREANLATQRRLGDYVINEGHLEAIEDVFASDAHDHDPAPDQGPGSAGFQRFFAALTRAFPDAKVYVDATVAAGDQVAIAYRLTGTHRGTFNGIAPTGRSIEARGLQIARFEDGKIVERWGSSDQLGILTQLGVAVPGA